MSEFMREIVQEVLKESTTIRSVKGANSNVSNEQHHSMVRKPLQNASDLHRPNYQKLKKEQRLEELKVFNPQRDSGTASAAKPEKELVSKLQVLSLSQGRQSASAPTPSASTKKDGHLPSGQWLGDTRCGISAWLYTGLLPEMMEWFHRPIPAKAVAVFTSQQAAPGHLVIVQEWLEKNEHIKFYIQWDKKGQSPFLLELFHHDSFELESAVRTLFQTLNHQTEKAVKQFYIEQPGAWLLKQLELSCTRNSLAIIEGPSRYQALSLLLSYHEQLSQKQIRYQLEDHYFILYGPHQKLSQLLPELYRQLE